MSETALPKPNIRPTHWQALLIWLVPLAAAIAGVVYAIEYHNERASEIIVQFSDAQGMKIGQTPVSHLGVDLGRVSDIELTPDHSAALVHIQLNKNSADFARGGTSFWIERAEFSAGNISGLTTIVSGPYIDAIAGTGPSATQFMGLDKKPVILGPGMKLILHTLRLAHLQRDSGVYFRGIQVGLVQAVQLEQDASGVDVHIFIWQRYVPLVRANSEFWIEKGIDLSGSIFSGLKLDVSSLRTIISGGVALATPTGDAPQASEGAEFPLNNEPKKEWLEWGTEVHLPPDTAQEGDDEQSPKSTGALKAIQKEASKQQ